MNDTYMIQAIMYPQNGQFLLYEQLSNLFLRCEFQEFLLISETSLQSRKGYSS